MAPMTTPLWIRFRRYLDHDEKFNVLPDLILMDGGLGQVGVACRVLAQAGLEVPVFGMVKDHRHRTRGLVAPDGREIGLERQPAVFALVGRIQEETHRFAIEYHRRQALLKTFKSVQGIRSADYEALCRVVPKPVAQAVYQHFHGEAASGDQTDKGESVCE